MLKCDEAQAANANMEADRYTDLEGQGVISREQADQQRTQASSNLAAVLCRQGLCSTLRRSGNLNIRISTFH